MMELTNKLNYSRPSETHSMILKLNSCYVNTFIRKVNPVERSATGSLSFHQSLRVEGGRCLTGDAILCQLLGRSRPLEALRCDML